MVNNCNNNFENKIIEGKQGKIFVQQILSLTKEVKNNCVNEDDVIICSGWNIW